MTPQINLEVAEQLFETFKPMFAELEKRGIDYCLVGGLAVLAQVVARGESRGFRATRDADLLVQQGFSNGDFAEMYLDVYATDPSTSEAVYGALFGDSSMEELNEGEAAFMSLGFVGASDAVDGIDTPDFDICRTLNARTLATIKRERLRVFGTELWVATPDELYAMKSATIALYGAGPLDSSRPQDFEDLAALRTIIGSPKPAASETPRQATLADRIKSLLGGNR